MHRLALCLLLLTTTAQADCLSQLEQQSRYPLHYLSAWSVPDGIEGRLYVRQMGVWWLMRFECKRGFAHMEYER